MKIAQCLFATLGLLFLMNAAGAPATSKFTYQGLLEQSNAPASGTFDLSFEPFSALSGGTSLATALVVNDVVVVNGVFTATLDFGQGFFVGDQVFLNIGVRVGTSTGSFTNLAPRQEILATPYAQTALSVADTAPGQGSAARIGFVETPINSVPSQSPSVIIGTDGFPIISFFDPVDGDLRVAHCLDRACVSRELFTLDTAGIVGEFSSITIRNNGLPAISYYDRSNGNLKLAYCLTSSCSTSSLQNIDSTGDVGQYTSIVSGDPTFAALIVFYHDVTNGDLKSAKCGLTSCATPTLITLDSTGTVGQFTSSAIGAGATDVAIVWVAYYDATNTAMKTMACITTGCGTTPVTPRTIETGVTAVNSSSIAIGGDNRAWISYNTGTIAHIAHCESRSACSTPTVTNLVGIQGYVATTTGLDGVVWTSGRLTDGRVRTGRCEGTTACIAHTTWTSTAAGNTQPSPLSITLGIDGIPLVVEASSSRLTVFHCSSPTTCIDSAWPR